MSQALPDEPVTIEVELIGNVPKTVRAPFVTHAKTGLISVWMLFPADQPYRSYSLVDDPIDRSLPPRIMNNRYVIEHLVGTAAGWGGMPRTAAFYLVDRVEKYQPRKEILDGSWTFPEIKPSNGK